MSSATARAGYADATAEPAGVGWVVFASILLFIAGTWNFIDGILAIGSSHVYLGGAHYIFGGLNSWGWIVMLLGVTQLAAGAAVVNGSSWARWFGIFVAGINSIGQLAFLPAYPFWALSMFTVDMLIIYGLAVYGGPKLRGA
jgi:hypothetical protein